MEKKYKMEKKVIMAMVWRDFKAIVHRKKPLLINLLFLLVFTAGFALVSILLARKDGGLNILLINKLAIHVGIMTGYMALLSELKFWQRKMKDTLISLTLLPVSIQVILISKSIVPIALSILMGIVDTFIFKGIAYLLSDIFTLSIFSILLMVVILLVFGLLVSYIYGYAVWFLAAANAKLVQTLILTLFLGLLGGFFLKTKVPIGLTTISAILLALFAGLSYFSRDTVKVMHKFYK